MNKHKLKCRKCKKFIKNPIYKFFTALCTKCPQDYILYLKSDFSDRYVVIGYAVQLAGIDETTVSVNLKS